MIPQASHFLVRGFALDLVVDNGAKITAISNYKIGHKHCGLAGIWHLSRLHRDRARRHCDKLRHAS